jgi:hypothetical protein
MNAHREAQECLYDLAVGRLADGIRGRVERHLETCSECRADLDSFREVIGALPPSGAEPEEALGEAYWHAFAERVEERLLPDPHPRPGIFREMGNEVIAILSRSWRPVWATAATVAIGAAAFLLVQRGPGRVESLQAPQATATDSTSLKIARYLQRSSTLLVGLANRDPQEEETDLSAEREISRKLVRESRELRGEPIDPQSAALLGDLERIMIEIANRDPDAEGNHLDVIRQGISSGNLLFKVRMTEELMTHRAQLQVASHER